MKRLLPYVILAFAFHAIILSSDFSWLRLAPIATPAATSLSITLSANKLQEQKVSAAPSSKSMERQLEPGFNQEPMKNPDTMPAPAEVEHSAKLKKPLPTTPPKKIVKKPRLKKSLKALTYKKPQIKTSETARTASSPKPHVALKADTRIFKTASANPQPDHRPLSADTSLTKKTHRVPRGSPEQATTAVMPPATQIENNQSGKVIKLALPLYKQNTAPPYPLRARRLGYEGIVMLKVLINETGRVDDLTVLKSSGHSVLDRAALSAVKKWLFEPGTEGGVKKKMWVKIPVRFDLK